MNPTTELLKDRGYLKKKKIFIALMMIMILFTNFIVLEIRAKEYCDGSCTPYALRLQCDQALPYENQTFNFTIFSENDQVNYLGNQMVMSIDDQLDEYYGYTVEDAAPFNPQDCLGVVNITNGTGHLKYFELFSVGQNYRYNENGTKPESTWLHPVNETNREVYERSSNLSPDENITYSTLYDPQPGTWNWVFPKLRGGFKIEDYNDYWYRVRCTAEFYNPRNNKTVMKNMFNFSHWFGQLFDLDNNLLISKTNTTPARLEGGQIEPYDEDLNPLFIGSRHHLQGYTYEYFNGALFYTLLPQKCYVDKVSAIDYESGGIVYNQTYNVTLRYKLNGQLWGVFIEKNYNDTESEFAVGQERIEIWFGDPYYDFPEPDNTLWYIIGGVGGGAVVVAVLVIVRKRKKKPDLPDVSTPEPTLNNP